MKPSLRHRLATIKRSRERAVSLQCAGAYLWRGWKVVPIVLRKTSRPNKSA